MNLKEQKNLIQLYNKFDILLEKGDGVYLYDNKGNKYLDFFSGIGVNALGYNNKYYNNALKKQINKILHISNLFHNQNIALAAKNLAKASGLDRVFFTNSGTEAIEGALKVAKKFAFNKNIKNPQFIAFKNSFHGRTLGALSLTANEKYQKPFKPLISGIKFAKFNDINSVEKLINEKICAIFIETIQGEGGINPANKEFYKNLRTLCDKMDILLIVDEIQCGMGRTGKYFAYEHFEILPDILTSAKALGCGVSVGAFVVSEKIAQKTLVPGDHGSTYGGNPFVCAAINAVFECFKKQNILDNVNNLSAYFKNALLNLKNQFSFIKEISGIGFMLGLSLNNTIKANDIVKEAQNNGLLIITCGKNDLRFLPPLIITKENIDEMVDKLSKSLKIF